MNMQRVAEHVGTAAVETDGADIPAVHTVELAKHYGNTVALASLSMTVSRGEVFGFLGPNGAGKTTAVKLLVGLSRPTAGEAWVLGASIGDVPTRLQIGYLPELFRYQDWLTGREVLDLHCKLAKTPREDRRAEVAHALEIAGLEGRGDDRVGTYSKGMQQRLGLGAALLGRPEVVFLDEPTSALDPVGRHDVRMIIRNLKERGATVFLNSHLLSEVEQVCDRVAVVDQGRVIALGTLDELRGAAKAVRIRAGGLDQSILEAASSFGEAAIEGDSIIIRGLQDDAVPLVISRLVQLGARIYAVQPSGGTLEDSFLNLMEAQSIGSAHHRGPHTS